MVSNGRLVYTNPVYPGYFADPFAFRHEGVYYAIGTSPTDEVDNVFTMLRSENLVDWQYAGGALTRPSPELGTDFWAPEIAYEGGRFWMYYSVGFSDTGHQIRVATSDRPEGPYEDLRRISDEDCDFAIDASPFRDEDGRWYLFYAMDFLDTDRPGTALVVQPLASMDALGSSRRTVMRASNEWQRFKRDRPMYESVYDWHTLEGPCVRRHGGRYYCFYSGGNWQDDTYGLDYVVANEPMGPYKAAESDLPRILRTIPGRVLGPGHNSIVEGPDGCDYLVYHAWDAGMTARRMCIDRLDWTSDGPRCDGPSFEPRTIGGPA
jgi:beta-xylosidase